MSIENSGQLIVVRQLPVIEEQLRTIRPEIEKKVSEAMALACSEETITEVKAVRAELNKLFGQFEDRRKQVKAAVMAPYDQFNEAYEACVSSLFSEADADLKGKIADVENGLKQRCEEGLKEYFAECCEELNVGFVEYKALGIKVDMASAKAKTPTRIRKAIRTALERIALEAEALSGMEYGDEILVEYHKNLNAAAAMAIVQARHRAVEQQRQQAEQAAQIRQAEQQRQQAVAAFATPVQKKVEETVECGFIVEDTIPRLRLLKQFLEANGYKYRNL